MNRNRKYIGPDCDDDDEDGLHRDSLTETALECLFNKRTIYLFEEIGPAQSRAIISQLMHLESLDPKADITLIINSPGGLVTDTLAIYDAMQRAAPAIRTHCIGHCASGAALLLCAGTKGKRIISPNAYVMIHCLSGGIIGTKPDMDIEKDQVDREQTRLNAILAAHTGKPAKVIADETKRDLYLAPAQAVEYGLADRVADERGWFARPAPKRQRRNGRKPAAKSARAAKSAGRKRRK